MQVTQMYSTRRAVREYFRKVFPVGRFPTLLLTFCIAHENSDAETFQNGNDKDFGAMHDASPR